MVQRYRDGEVIILADSAQRSLKLLNVAFVGTVVTYWILFIALLFNLDWAFSRPLAAQALVPTALALITIWGARAASNYTRRVRGKEDIDTRTRVWKWLLLPVMLPLGVPFVVLDAAFHWSGLASRIASWAFVVLLVSLLQRFGPGPDIGDFTFE
jgi:membrane protease YdiL (CAAX protease family)